MSYRRNARRRHLQRAARAGVSKRVALIGWNDRRALQLRWDLIRAKSGFRLAGVSAARLADSFVKLGRALGRPAAERLFRRAA